MEVIVRNNVNVIGHGDRTIVMAHGFGCDQTVWHYMVDAFSDEYRIVLFDYVGAGKSAYDAYDRRRYGSLSGYVQDVLEVLEDQALEDVIFVGHSVSSMIGAMAAVQQPARFSKLVMIAPSPRYLNDPPDYLGGFERQDVSALLDMMEHNYSGWAHYLAPVAMKNEDRPELSEDFEARLCALDPYIARQFAEVTFLSDTRMFLPKITTPTLLLQCLDDVIAPIGIGSYLAERIEGSTLRVMNATGHCPHLSRPAETIALIQEFLRSPAAMPA